MRGRNGMRTVLVGAASGAFASWVMEQAQAQLAKVPLDAGGGDKPSTVEAADRAALAATGAPVPGPQRKQAGRAVHYAMGTTLGVAYALLAERRPVVSAGFGSLYGLAVSALLDEGAAPALKLSPPPTQTPPWGHAYGLLAHVVFGLALETGRQALGPGRRD